MLLRCINYALVAEVIIYAHLTLISKTPYGIEATLITYNIVIGKLRIFRAISDSLLELKNGIIKFFQQPEPVTSQIVILPIVWRLGAESFAKSDPLRDIFRVSKNLKFAY